MSYVSSIEWTESSWNPVTGCRKVSPACENCYAERFANRFRGVKGHPYERGFEVQLWPERLSLPLRWRKPRRIFVNSMSDLFLEDIPYEFIDKVFETMKTAYWHTFQLLTKHSERMVQWITMHLERDTSFPQNVWCGVSVENNDYLYRIDHLRKIPAFVRFVSFEPLIGNLTLDSNTLEGIHWVIVGGETGPRARRMEPSWVDNIYFTCQSHQIPFFFKQWGAYNKSGEKVRKSKSGRNYHGCEWNEMPVVGSFNFA